MEEVSIDVLPGVKPWLVEWTRCSDSGRLCDCPGRSVRPRRREDHYEDDGAYFKENPHRALDDAHGRPGCAHRRARAKSLATAPVPGHPRGAEDVPVRPLVKPYQYKISGVTWGKSTTPSARSSRCRTTATGTATARRGRFLSAAIARMASRRRRCRRRRTGRSGRRSSCGRMICKVQGRWFMRATDASRGCSATWRAF